MRYAAICQGRTMMVDLIDDSDPQAVQLCIDGRPVTAQVTGLGASEVGITLGTEQFWLQVEGDTVWLGERRLRAEVVDLRTLALKQAQAAAENASGVQTVRAPMPGRVTAVLVQEGQKVEAGAPLLVVEAMKMENELRAPQAGVVAELKAVAGDTVELGAILCSVA